VLFKCIKSIDSSDRPSRTLAGDSGGSQNETRVSMESRTHGRTRMKL